MYNAFPDTSLAPVDEQVVAAVVAAALLDDDRVGHAYELSGPEPLTTVERVAIFGEVLGRPLTAGGALTDEELVGVSLLLLFAGHETTANMLGLGTLALLSHPERAEALREGRVDETNAVEELLRYLSSSPYRCRPHRSGGRRTGR
ncbi:cytochrome P450 [Nonomuraea sp. NPDC046802]|uniref:cytochrome P450 n=1 Tax=Nonomuraea sp. NPDC046802 TaxID=3154919 RepID=UPI0033D23959